MVIQQNLKTTLAKNILTKCTGMRTTGTRTVLVTFYWECHRVLRYWKIGLKLFVFDAKIKQYEFKNLQHPYKKKRNI